VEEVFGAVMDTGTIKTGATRIRAFCAASNTDSEAGQIISLASCDLPAHARRPSTAAKPAMPSATQFRETFGFEQRE
jgi:hypothetical protein